MLAGECVYRWIRTLISKSSLTCKYRSRLQQKSVLYCDGGCLCDPEEGNKGLSEVEFAEDSVWTKRGGSSSNTASLEIEDDSEVICSVSCSNGFASSKPSMSIVATCSYKGDCCTIY